MPETETVHLHILLEVIVLPNAKGKGGGIVPRAATLSDTSLYLFVEDTQYFLVEPLLTAKEKRANKKDGGRLLREDAKYRWDSLLEVDFLARDQSVIALRFASGNCHLRFGDDFGLSLFKYHLRQLLPDGLAQWRRDFGNAGAPAVGGGGDAGGDDDEEDEDRGGAQDEAAADEAAPQQAGEGEAAEEVVDEAE